MNFRNEVQMLARLIGQGIKKLAKRQNCSMFKNVIGGDRFGEGQPYNLEVHSLPNGSEATSPTLMLYLDQSFHAHNPTMSHTISPVYKTALAALGRRLYSMSKLPTGSSLAGKP
jgi:hypothetical protein